jgi:hypothetical protein
VPILRKKYGMTAQAVAERVLAAYQSETGKKRALL